MTYTPASFWYNWSNYLPSEHVFSFHPASQPAPGHRPFTLLHLTPFKQWQLLLHPSPKLPLSHSVIRNHSNNEKEIFVDENNNQCQSTQNNKSSVHSEHIENIRCSKKRRHLFIKQTKTISIPLIHNKDNCVPLIHIKHTYITLINIKNNYKPRIHIKHTYITLIHIKHTSITLINIQNNYKSRIHIKHTSITLINIKNNYKPSIHLKHTYIALIRITHTSITLIKIKIIINHWYTLRTHLWHWYTLNTYIYNTNKQ